MTPTHRVMFAFLFCSAISSAQQAKDGKVPDASEKTPPTSIVSGHVYLDDTKAPARKATVFLQPVASFESDAPPEQGGGHDNGSVTMGVGTQFDGSYSFTHVARGSYYVIVTCPGYISPLLSLSLAEARSPYGEWAPLGPQQKAAKNKVLQSLPRVNVESNLSTGVDVVLERGGAVSGTVTYDDGGTAAGLRAEIPVRMIRDGRKSWESVDSQHPRFTLPIVTDDRGNYRINGLPPGQYVVEVALDCDNTKMYISSSGGSSSNSSNAHSPRLVIYSGNTPREKDAIGFTIQAREERTGEDIVIPISKLHTITGNLVSAHDGHVVNSGQVDILNADDRSFAGSDSLTEEDSGFMLSFVFEGDYILSSPASADVAYVPLPRPQGDVGPPQFGPHPLHFYGSASKPLHVDGDMDGVTLAVPEPNAKEAQMYKEAMQQQQERENPSTVPQ